MKKFVFLLLLFPLLLISSCLDDEGYSLGDAWIDFGVVNKSGSGFLDFSVKTDHGELLYPVSSEISFDIEDKNRILINYTILGEKNTSGANEEFYIKINSIRKILKKGILEITEGNKDSIGNDPVIVTDHWMANNLLNFKLKYYGDYQVHFINLVKKPGPVSVADQPVELELRHNRNGDQERFPFAAYVSFDLSAITIAGRDSVRFKVSSENYDGDMVTFTGVYKYGKSN